MKSNPAVNGWQPPVVINHLGEVLWLEILYLLPPAGFSQLQVLHDLDTDLRFLIRFPDGFDEFRQARHETVITDAQIVRTLGWNDHRGLNDNGADTASCFPLIPLRSDPL